jgi:peptidylprolyl isomerase
MIPRSRISLSSRRLLATALVPWLLASCTVADPDATAEGGGDQAAEAVASPAPPPVAGDEEVVYAMRYIEVAPGTGAEALPGQCYYVHYTGYLTDGSKFDSSRDTASDGSPRTPLSFHQGRRNVIAGWDSGFEGMNVGGQRRLIIPYQLAYGVDGRPPVIPPSSTLVFDVELMDVREGPELAAQGETQARCPAWEG